MDIENAVNIMMTGERDICRGKCIGLTCGQCVKKAEKYIDDHRLEFLRYINGKGGSK